MSVLSVSAAGHQEEKTFVAGMGTNLIMLATSGLGLMACHQDFAPLCGSSSLMVLADSVLTQTLTFCLGGGWQTERGHDFGERQTLKNALRSFEPSGWLLAA